MTALDNASDPAGADSLAVQARSAIQNRDASTALRLLARIPPEAMTADSFMDRAMALRMTGDSAAALRAVEGALARDPYHFLALLSKAALVERLEGWKAAAPVYKNALALAPAEADLPESLRAPTRRAREIVERFAAGLYAHLQESVRELRSRHAEEPLARFDESLEIFSGRAKPYPHEPALLHYPRLPAIPFFDRSLFPWLERLEAATPVIQEELAGALTTHADKFAPYIDYPPGVPVNQWGELNHSPLWQTFFLWKDGTKQEEACRQCPRTAALLESLPMTDQPGFAPTAVFSALEAHTHIPPHSGSANTRLLVHLPLILPGPARFRVGAETRPWRMGEAWVFDDSINHEAWNDADQLRVILIFDVWNPLLSAAERALITTMMAAKNTFQTTL